MMNVGKITGSIFSCSINELIDQDVRFDKIPEEFLSEDGTDDLYDGEVEIYKYNDKCDTF